MTHFVNITYFLCHPGHSLINDSKNATMGQGSRLCLGMMTQTSFHKDNPTITTDYIITAEILFGS